MVSFWATFPTLLTYFCCFWAAMTLLTYLVPVVYANLLPPVNLKKKYGAQWALVTGASSGIGKSLAEALAAQGLNVVLVALNDELLQKTFAELRTRYPAVEFRSVGVDLTRADGSYISVIDKATRDLHVPIHFLNAGFMVPHRAAPRDRTLGSALKARAHAARARLARSLLASRR